MRRGLTLIELLASIALLSVVMTASASWLRIVAEAERVATTTLDWETAAEAVLQCIHDDLQAGDFEDDTEGRSGRRRRTERRHQIDVQDDRLVIHTRCDRRGVIENVYLFDLPGKRLVLQTERMNQQRPPVPLLEEITSFECELDEEASTLLVTLDGDGSRCRRRYRVR